MVPRSASVRGVGGYLPPRMVGNDEFAARLDTSDEWIRSHLGIRSRRIAEKESTSDLAVKAGNCALESAGTGVDSLVLATTTPDHPVPASAPAVAARLGLGPVAAFDLNSACSSFVYALAVSASMIVAGLAERVLVIGADTATTLIDPADRLTSVIFGDGAGAVVLEAGDAADAGAVGPFVLGSDGGRGDLLVVPGGGSRQRKDLVPPQDGPFLRMEGRGVFDGAVAGMSATVGKVAAQAGWRPGDIDRLACHQANQRIIDAVGARLGLPPDRLLSNIEHVGNTSAASVPLLLAESSRRGRLAEGQRVVLAAFGAGLAWGAAALRWPGVRAVTEGVADG
ncbi:beta-ketoacyl-ACP synthase 3 [Actinomadura macrotermitis]|uniref:Beta-ketoacyl-[acyl-carrier-protein] synthase III n=1 Tax=Actinomadura macrotermitis TaxID=2585200 RepID=A0A7K0C3B1_9ACTN|nr:beta-ketoacyl-ACP synthase 3 [Actinomadura macrotermitis]MQY07866.1 3-oxoacyl-[acyl-carrier-protein] synthase 3 [Actinomadura macrotermitis]